MSGPECCGTAAVREVQARLDAALAELRRLRYVKTRMALAVGLSVMAERLPRCGLVVESLYISLLPDNADAQRDEIELGERVAEVWHDRDLPLNRREQQLRELRRCGRVLGVTPRADAGRGGAR